MSSITLFKYEKLGNAQEIAKALNCKRIEGSWITAKPSKYSKNEVFIQYYWYEDIEDSLKRAFSEDADEIVSFLKQNGKTKVLKRTYCFINLLTKTLEVYRGLDNKTEEIVSTLEKLLGTKFLPVRLRSQDLQKIYSKHSLELKQAMFKNINGLIYEILRGRFLENNEKFKEYLEKFPECLRVISFRPKIKFLGNSNKYQVTINGDKGSIRFSSGNGIFKFRPRYEIRQVVFLISATLGLLPS